MRPLWGSRHPVLPGPQFHGLLSPSHVPPGGPLVTGMIVAAPGTHRERDSNLLTRETFCSSAGRGGMHGCTLNTAYQLMVTLRRKIKWGKGAEREKVGEAGGGHGDHQPLRLAGLEMLQGQGRACPRAQESEDKEEGRGKDRGPNSPSCCLLRPAWPSWGDP